MRLDAGIPNLISESKSVNIWPFFPKVVENLAGFLRKLRKLPGILPVFDSFWVKKRG